MSRKKKVRARFNVASIDNPGGSIAYNVMGYKRDGERVRENYANRQDAEDRRAELEEEYSGQADLRISRRTSLTQDQLSDAELALKAIPARITLVGMVSKFHEIHQRLDEKGLSLDQAIDFAVHNYKRDFIQMGVYSAVDQFLVDKRTLSATTQSNYKRVLKLLLADPNRLVSDFTPQAIRDILSVYDDPETYRTYLGNLSVFFRWATRRDYVLENPCDKVELLPRAIKGIGILSFDEVKHLLKASMGYQNGVMVSSIAIALFAGLRPSELQDLKPSDVRPTAIRVDGGKMRRKTNRVVPISPVLKSWLDAFSFKGRPSGWRYKFRTLLDAVEPGDDVKDILRHTSISFQMERDIDPAIVAKNCGNSPRVIEARYREVIEEKDDVETFWSLTPEGLLAESIEVTLPSTAKQVAWPSDAQLTKLVFAKPLTAIGEELGVSDNAVRKRCLSRGIELPKNGYWQKKRTRG